MFGEGRGAEGHVVTIRALHILKPWRGINGSNYEYSAHRSKPGTDMSSTYIYRYIDIDSIKSTARSASARIDVRKYKDEKHSPKPMRTAVLCISYEDSAKDVRVFIKQEAVARHAMP